MGRLVEPERRTPKCVTCAKDNMPAARKIWFARHSLFVREGTMVERHPTVKFYPVKSNVTEMFDTNDGYYLLKGRVFAEDFSEGNFYWDLLAEKLHPEDGALFLPMEYEQLLYFRPVFAKTSGTKSDGTVKPPPVPQKYLDYVSRMLAESVNTNMAYIWI